jgi:hypothetical protein
VPLLYTGNGTTFSESNHRARGTFWSLLDTWLLNMNHYSYWYGGYGMVSRIATAGVGGCYGHVSNHDDYNAADLSRIEWSNGTLLNMYAGDHNHPSRTVRRRYLAVSASLRKWFGYTLDGVLADTFDGGDHNNHFHVDPLCPTLLNLTGSSRSRGTNICFIQSVCNEFDNAGLAVNGQWNTATSNAWFNFKWKTRTWCYSEQYNVPHWRIILDMIMRHGFADKDAGHYQSGCSPIL